MLSIFLCTSWPSIYLLWRSVYLGLRPFLYWFVSFDEIKPHELFVNFEDYSLTSLIGHNYFFSICGCLFKVVFFFFLTVFFSVEKLFSLSRSHLFIFVFIFILLGDEVKKILL